MDDLNKIAGLINALVRARIENLHAGSGERETGMDRPKFHTGCLFSVRGVSHTIDDDEDKIRPTDLLQWEARCGGSRWFAEVRAQGSSPMEAAQKVFAKVQEDTERMGKALLAASDAARVGEGRR
jgi:hypothetical protein